MTRPVLKKSLLELQRFSRSFAEKFGLIVVVLLVIGILSLPYFLKDTSLTLGRENYYHLRVAGDILNGKFDEISFDSGWSILIASTNFVFGLNIEAAMSILLFLLGVIAAILFYNILNMFESNLKFISSLILIISPIFIYLFTEGGKYSVTVVLFLLLSYFVLNKKYVRAGLSFIVIPLFDLGSAIFVFLMLVCYFLYIRRKRLLLGGLVLLILILSFVYFKNFTLDFISDLGARIGLSIFAVFLFFIGFGLFWKKRKFLLLYLVWVILFLFSLKFSWVLIYLNLFLAVIVAVCFIELFKRKWESNLIKSLTLLLLICGLLFSGLSYAKMISEDTPEEEFFEALSLLPDKALVFSSLENKHWIEYGKKRSVEIKGNDFNEVLMLRDAEISRFLLDKYNIEYILIDNKMEKEVWSDEMKGLRWVLNYDEEHFRRIYGGENVKIWEFFEK